MDFQTFEPWKPPTYLIDPARYGEFLVEAFDRWYQDGGPTMSVRIFDNFLHSYAGIPNDLCVHSDRCDTGLVVEWDGSAYPCDFYVHPSFRLGSVMDVPLAGLMNHPQRAAFVAQKSPLPDECALRMAGGVPERLPAQPDEQRGRNPTRPLLCQLQALPRACSCAAPIDGGRDRRAAAVHRGPTDRFTRDP